MVKYTVDLSTHTSGRFESFMLKRKALQFIRENRSYPFIDLKNNWSDCRTRVKNDPDGKRGDENCEHHWIGEPGHVRCNKCNATQKTACNHTGSFGCVMCNEKFADELNDPNGKLDKEHHKWTSEGNFCPTCGNILEKNICNNKYCYLLR